jgi:ABC-type iron transport system FetAB ATPase subunit
MLLKNKFFLPIGLLCFRLNKIENKKMNSDQNHCPIKIDNLSIHFGSKQILKDISLCLKQGEKVAISGESGAGKSTILRCVLGYIPFESGKIFIEGEEITTKNIWDLRHFLGYVPQEPDLGQGNVKNVLLVPFQYKANRHLTPEKKQIDELFDKFRLDRELIEKDVSKISGGEKQRVAIITALLLKRRIYLLDEITSALDDKSKEAVANYFKSRRDITVIAVTHDARFKTICNQVFRLDKRGYLKD